MACYKLTSCTAGNPLVLWSTDPAFAGLVGGSPFSLTTYSTVCFNVEYVEDPCPCQPNSVPYPQANQALYCECTSPYLCYKLQDCTDPLSPYIYVTGFLNPYIGLTVSVAEFPGHCYNVIGVTDAIECDTNTPTPVTCVNPCTCSLNCAELTNCGNPAEVIYVNGTLAFTLNNVIAPTPSIIPPGGNNCWTVTAVNIQPCNPTFGTTITSFTDYGPDNCSICAGPPTCYKLTSCDGLTVIYSQSALGPYVGGSPIQSTVFPGQCWIVTTLAEGEDCINPVIIEPLSISYCTCPCYTLTNCITNEVINSNSNLAAVVGQSVHLDEYGGCEGDCWLVAVNPPPAICDFPVTVTVSTNCAPCGPCGETCYELVDCETNVVFVTALNPTANSVDLSTLVTGQAIGQINIDGEITNGCWYVRLAEECSTGVIVSVYNIYQPAPDGTTGCEQCLNSCYGLLNCKTLEVDYIIKYTVSNPNGLPNPNTITGVIGDLCFEEPIGCVEGCYIFQVIPGASCEDSIDWTEVVSYNDYENCDDCLPKCYLLTECLPAVTPPFIVSNDLSLYVGSVAKICDSEGNCHCYNVELAQTCEGSIVIDNANASFTTCEECNSCDCPPGYTKIGDYCQKITTVPATPSQTTYISAPGSDNLNYGQYGTRFYANVTSLPYPLTAVAGPDRFVDAATTNVPYTSITTGIWGPNVYAPPPVYISRLNTVGIWTNLPCMPNCPPTNEWIGFTKCIEITEPGTYCVGIGGDDCVRMKLDGVQIAEACIGVFDFRWWHVFELNLTAGTHVIVVEGKSTVYAASFGAEIYQTDIATLQTINTIPALQAITVFSTFPFRSTPTPFQTGENSGYSCPPGATLNLCGTPSCTIIETIPFVPCAPTYKVKDCTGVQPDFITNTDLSTYLTGSYKTCITSSTYSTTCFLLKDCNRLTTDVVTTSNMQPYLWTSVSLVEYPGSCFIVLPMPANTVCVDNPVTLDPDAQCNCPNAQEPWPNGCYCVTVEEVTPPTVAPDFTGVFEPKMYECCDDCTRTCYLLTDCNEILTPVVVCNDLAQYVGHVIKIEGCGDICWQVDIAENCDSNTLFSGEITMFDDCETCLPPVPPPPPPYDLHLRKIKPGYNSPNSCYTTSYIEKINCAFAEQVYNAMLVKRYGITVCCEEDLNTWDIKKQLMDLDILKDPNMCKSTLCDCKAPCLVDVVFQLLPVCGNPIIVSVIPNLPCEAPVVTTIEIEVPVTPADCNCYTITPLEQPIQIQYLDCCCVLQQVLIDSLDPVNVCASTAPAVYPESGSATVVLNGDCNDPGPCNPPVCYCWKVTNESSPGSPDGNAIFDTCSTMGLSLYANVPAGGSVSNCSFGPPTVSSGLVVENMGPCVDGACVPPVCQCYQLTLNNGGSTDQCEFSYTNCDGIPSTVVVHTGETVYLCSQTAFTPMCSHRIDYTLSVINQACQLDGTCTPPANCVCYEVIVGNATGTVCGLTYTPCGQPPLSVLVPAGTYYYCSETVPALDLGSSCTITVSSTPYDCQSCGPL